MTYEELKKQATPGPLRHVKFNNQELADGSGICILAYACGMERDEANAKLVKHCINNFDRALEALKTLENMHYCPACGEVATHKSGCWLPRLISELETVKDTL